MGMDVVGVNNPDAYFRANVWSWHPIWNCTVDLAPWVAEHVPGAHYNDGDGLNEELAEKLHSELALAVDAGQHEQWLKEFNKEIEELPDRACNLCEATGIRTDDVGMEHNMPTKIWVDEKGEERVGWCNGCDGAGYRKDFATWYGFSPDHFEEWVTFLGQCGGFEIW